MSRAAGRVFLVLVSIDLAFALAVALGACTSIPLSTAMKLSTRKETDFASLDPREIRVRVAVPKGYTWDAEGAQLEAEVDAGARTWSKAFGLSQISQETGVRRSGLFDEGAEVSVTTLRLADRSISSFRELQNLIGGRKADRIRLGVKLAMLTAPSEARSVRVWIEAMVSPQEGYFTLIDGAIVRLDATEVYGKPAR